MTALLLIPLAAFLVAGWVFRRRVRPMYLSRIDTEHPQTFDRIVCGFCRKWVKARIVNGVVRTECLDCGVIEAPLGQEARETVPNLAHRKEPGA